MRAVATMLVALVAACGGTEEPEPEAPLEPPPVGEPQTTLEVTVWPEGRDGGFEQVNLLECDPPGGTHPAAEEACAALEESPDALDPVPEDVMCTQIYGGPEQARVEGVFAGREIEARFSKANGCEIARWEALEPVFRVELD